MATIDDSWYLYPLTIDTAYQSIPDVLVASPEDYHGKGILLTLKYDGAALDTSGCEVLLAWHNLNSGCADSRYFEGVSSSAGQWKCTYPTEMLTTGMVEARIIVRNSDSDLITSSRLFKIRVERDVGGALSGESDDDLSLFQQAISSLTKRCTNYGTCTTASATAAKIGNVDNFVLSNGVCVALKFTRANTSSSPTLNVGDTGAKPLRLYVGTTLTVPTSDNGYSWEAGEVVPFIYNDTYWLMLDGGVRAKAISAYEIASKAASSVSEFEVATTDDIDAIVTGDTLENSRILTTDNLAYYHKLISSSFSGGSSSSSSSFSATPFYNNEDEGRCFYVALGDDVDWDSASSAGLNLYLKLKWNRYSGKTVFGKFTIAIKQGATCSFTADYTYDVAVEKGNSWQIVCTVNSVVTAEGVQTFQDVEYIELVEGEIL